MRGVMSREHLREVTPDFRFHTDPEIRKDVQATAEEALAWEVLQVNALLRLLNLLLLNLRLQSGLKALPTQSVPLGSALLKTCAQLAIEDWTAAPMTQASEQVGMAAERSYVVLVHALEQKMKEVRNHRAKRRGHKLARCRLE